MEKKTSEEDKNKFVFFLGGHDAEMVTIQKMLADNNIPSGYIKDKNLQWGAKLSDYKENISKLSLEQIPVFVELELDTKYPSNAIIVDHHNELAYCNPSSLEQIAKLLQVKLTKEQMYIAINDSKYIFGLKKMELTDAQINAIRKMDRDAQGVTEKDYKQANIAIKKFSTIIDEGVVLVENAPEKTSAVTDKIFADYEHIFVITTQGSITYSGNGKIVERLVDQYKVFKETNEGINFYYGGDLPDTGYFGANKALNKEEIKDVINKPIYSHHIFLFPFLLEDEIDIETKDMRESSWQKDDFTINIKPEKEFPCGLKRYYEEDIFKYNELRYFYEYVNKSLFSGYSTKTNYFKKNIVCGKDEFIISIKNIYGVEKYHLKIDDISLRIFDSNVGILSITLNNYFYQDFKSILKINDYGRRVYPQFLGLNGTKNTKDIFLPSEIELIINGEHFVERFETKDYFQKDLKIAGHIKYLLKPINKFKSIIDDRMYTLCWYGNEELINSLSSKCSHKDINVSYEYEHSENWYKYIFLDSNFPGVACESMKNELIKNATYPRFVDWGTLFGLTRYSFMCLSNRKDTAYNVIRNHMQKMYYQIAVLLLIQRASILSFNDMIEDISKQIEKLSKRHIDVTEDEIVRNVELIQSDVISFINRLWFDEVTPQDQGIEIYDLARKQMKLPLELETLKNKSKDLHNFVDLLTSERNVFSA
ncbi:MAG: hypothetical protein ABR980_10410 [Ignavibacteriaceae bacterium]